MKGQMTVSIVKYSDIEGPGFESHLGHVMVRISDTVTSSHSYIQQLRFYQSCHGALVQGKALLQNFILPLLRALQRSVADNFMFLMRAVGL